MILDTTFLIDLVRNSPQAVKKARDLAEHAEPLSTTAISIFELWQGTEDLKDKEKREKIEELLTGIGHFDFDTTAAKMAGQIHRTLRDIGQPIGARDTMIAGIAINHGEAVLTRNVKDFSKIEGLRIENY